MKYEGRGYGARTFGEGKLIFAILVLRNWLLMFYSSADNGGTEAILRGEKVVRSPAGVKDLRGLRCPCGMLVLLKGIASLTGVKSTSPPRRSSPLLRLTDISWSSPDFVLPSLFPSFLSSFLPSRRLVLSLLHLGPRFPLPRVHLRAFFFATFSHKGFQAHLASFFFQLDERLRLPGDIPDNLPAGRGSPEEYTVN